MSVLVEAALPASPIVKVKNVVAMAVKGRVASVLAERSAWKVRVCRNPVSVPVVANLPSSVSATTSVRTLAIAVTTFA
jgi:hypothetical protein